jgi:hypothetical protein
MACLRSVALQVDTRSEAIGWEGLTGGTLQRFPNVCCYKAATPSASVASPSFRAQPHCSTRAFASGVLRCRILSTRRSCIRSRIPGNRSGLARRSVAEGSRLSNPGPGRYPLSFRRQSRNGSAPSSTSTASASHGFKGLAEVNAIRVWDSSSSTLREWEETPLLIHLTLSRHVNTPQVDGTIFRADSTSS